jgi:hypothetical protein
MRRGVYRSAITAARFERVSAPMAGATGYERLNHNVHWLSDVVAAAALGTATAHFVMNRDNERHSHGMAVCVPLDRGVMLTYTVELP